MAKHYWLKSLKEFACGSSRNRQHRLRRRSGPARSRRLVLETLEDRLALSVGAFYDVTTTGDGAGSLTGGAGASLNPYTYTTLRGAIAAANTYSSGLNTIEFDPSLTSSAPATVDLSTPGDTTVGLSDFGISTNITIQGPTGSSNGITPDNTDAGQRLFYVSGTGSLTLENLTLEGGEAAGDAGGQTQFGGAGGGRAGLGGAVFDDGGSFPAQGCTFTNNTATEGNGGSNPAFADQTTGAGGGAGGGGLGSTSTGGTIPDSSTSDTGANGDGTNGGPGSSTGVGGVGGGGGGGGGGHGVPLGDAFAGGGGEFGGGGGGGGGNQISNVAHTGGGGGFGGWQFPACLLVAYCSV